MSLTDPSGGAATLALGVVSGVQDSGHPSGAAAKVLTPPSSGGTPPGLTTARDKAVARHLIMGDFVGAYGLPNPERPAVSDLIGVESPELPSVIQFVTAREAHGTGIRREGTEGEAAPPQPLVSDTMPLDSRGPAAGVQSSAGSAGAASPLVLMMAFAVIAAPCLELVSRPSAHLRCAEGRRLERPG
jgi:hypothetical protein